MKRLFTPAFLLWGLLLPELVLAADWPPPGMGVGCPTPPCIGATLLWPIPPPRCEAWLDTPTIRLRLAEIAAIRLAQAPWPAGLWIDRKPTVTHWLPMATHEAAAALYAEIVAQHKAWLQCNNNSGD